MQQELRDKLLVALMHAVPANTSLKMLEDLCAEEIKAIEPVIDAALNRWTCPDCGYDSMPYPPKDYHICPKCLVEFGNDDRKSKMTESITHDLRVVYEVAGGHTHFNIRTGKHGCTLGLAGDNLCMTNEEFAAWRSGAMHIEFVERTKT